MWRRTPLPPAPAPRHRSRNQGCMACACLAAVRCKAFPPRFQRRKNWRLPRQRPTHEPLPLPSPFPLGRGRRSLARVHPARPPACLLCCRLWTNCTASNINKTTINTMCGCCLFVCCGSIVGKLSSLRGIYAGYSVPRSLISLFLCHSHRIIMCMCFFEVAPVGFATTPLIMNDGVLKLRASRSGLMWPSHVMLALFSMAVCH